MSEASTLSKRSKTVRDARTLHSRRKKEKARVLRSGAFMLLVQLMVDSFVARISVEAAYTSTTFFLGYDGVAQCSFDAGLLG